MYIKLIKWIKISEFIWFTDTNDHDKSLTYLQLKVFVVSTRIRSYFSIKIKTNTLNICRLDDFVSNCKHKVYMYNMSNTVFAISMCLYTNNIVSKLAYHKLFGYVSLIVDQSPPPPQSKKIILMKIEVHRSIAFLPVCVPHKTKWIRKRRRLKNSSIIPLSISRVRLTKRMPEWDSTTQYLSTWH